MPYISDKQRKYFHANKEKIGAKVVAEFDRASKLKPESSFKSRLQKASK